MLLPIRHGPGVSPFSSAIASSPFLTNLAAYWKLDEASGTRADSLGVSNLADTGGVAQSVGKVASAAHFTRASSQLLNVASNASLAMGDIDFSIAGWFYADTIPSVYMGLVTKWDDLAVNAEYALYYKSIAGQKRFMFVVSNGGSFSTELEATTFGAITTATWYFVCVVHDSVANLLKINVNGGAFDTAALTTGVKSGNRTFRVGRDQGTNYWDGRVDELGVWRNRALTQVETQTLYKSGNGVTYPAFS